MMSIQASECDFIVPIETRVALIQRSCGYALRPTLSIDAIQRAVQTIKGCSPQCAVLVDNCYGEFTETQEPCHVSCLQHKIALHCQPCSIV